MDVVAYVDGLNLYYGLKSKFAYAYFWLDIVGLVRRIREPDNVLKVRYFTSIVRGDAEAAARQETYLAALSAHSPALEITRGYLKRKSARCRQCGTSWSCTGCRPPAIHKTYEEKLTDVAIGMAMAIDAAQGYGDMSLLISSDSDFHPAVDAVLRLAPDREVMIAHPPGRGPSKRAFARLVTMFEIPERHLRNTQLPAKVEGANGRVSERPPKWTGEGQRSG